MHLLNEKKNEREDLIQLTASPKPRLSGARVLRESLSFSEWWPVILHLAYVTVKAHLQSQKAVM